MKCLPADYVIDPARHLVITTGVGCVTFNEIKGLHDRLMRDPSFDPSFNQLVDTTEVTTLEVSAAEARELARGSVISRDSLRAFIVNTPAVAGLGLLLDIYREKHTAIQVFYDRNSAMMWLGLATEYRSSSSQQS